MVYKTKVMCRNCEYRNELTIADKMKVEDFLKDNVECENCKIRLDYRR